MPSSPANNRAGTAVSDVVMPKLGLTMTEGVLAEWLVGPGDRVAPGQAMFVVETDKIANEIEAPGEGEIVEILVESGETVPVGTPLARWTGKGFAGHGGGEAEAPQPAAAPPTAAKPPEPLRSGPDTGARVRATPLARRMAREAKLDISGTTGSGPHGRIKAADVEAAATRQQEAPEPAPGAAGERVAVSAKHLAMARRVSASTREVPHFYLTGRAEVSALLELRRQMNAAGGPKVTLTHFLLKAVGRALIERPEANRIWADDALMAFAGSDVGMVVDTPDGLFIPVLRGAGRQPMDGLALVAGALIDRAKGGALRRDEIEGGAASVSNVGMAGGVESMAPIINPPQSSILGVGSVVESFRPDPDGRPKLCRELALTLACDHRVFDGMSGARFLDAIVRGLENPHALLRTTEG